MNPTWFKAGMTAAVLSMVFSGAPVAGIAAGSDRGDTSGPATGTATTPSTAVPKQDTNATSGMAAGGPGVEGKQGGESGAQPKTPNGTAQPATTKK